MANIELAAARLDQEPIVANLLELYIHDFSEFRHCEPGADGRFGYGDLPLYWSDQDRHPYLVWLDGKPVGLVFVRRLRSASDNEFVWDMAEFFILRGFRRNRIGTGVAHEVWKKFPGPWQVRVMESNVPALTFWARAISTFLGNVVGPAPMEKNGERWFLFTFESRQTE